MRAKKQHRQPPHLHGATHGFAGSVHALAALVDEHTAVVVRVETRALAPAAILRAGGPRCDLGQAAAFLLDDRSQLFGVGSCVCRGGAC